MFINDKFSKNLFTNNNQCIYYGGSGNVIEYNHFYANNRYNEDTGVIYTYRDYLSAANKIRYNFFNDNGSYLPGVLHIMMVIYLAIPTLVVQAHNIK